MTTTLALNLTNPAAGDPSFWVSLEQVLPDEYATAEEAAEVIDKLFELSPCTAADDEQEEEQPSLEETLATAREIMADELLEKQDTLCTDATGCFPATMRVFRSHQDRPYTLLIAGGEVVQTVVGNVQQMVKTVPVEKSSSVSLDLPGDQPVSASWQGPCYAGTDRLDSNPEITVSNGRVFWSGSVTGVLRVAYPLPYDLVTIQTTEEDCTVTALYHLATDEIDLQPPPADDQAVNLCQQISSSIELLDDGEQRPCEELIYVDIRCDCTDEDSGKSYWRKESTICLPGEATNSDVNRGNTEISYTVCDGAEDAVHDPDYYESVCCTGWPYPRDLPRCQKKYSKYTHGSISSDQVADLIKTYGQSITLIPVGPDGGVCGAQILVQDVNQHNCCDGVSQLLWDYENSGDVVGGGSSVEVCVTGGKRPLEVKVRGKGFYLDQAHTLRDGIVNGNCFKIYTTSDACGTAQVYVTDGCSSVGSSIRSTAGWWETVYDDYAPDAYGGSVADLICGEGTKIFSYGFEKIEGGKRTVQSYSIWAGNLPYGDCYYACDGSANTQEICVTDWDSFVNGVTFCPGSTSCFSHGSDFDNCEDLYGTYVHRLCGGRRIAYRWVCE